MDELVFSREQLRRLLRQADKALGEASDAYDPSDTLPVEDTMALMFMQAVHEATKAYSQAMMVHVAMVSNDEGLKEKLKERGIDF